MVYECQANGAKVFVTTLKDCSIPEKFTFQTTTRQLFVGLLGLKVVSQDPVLIGKTRALQTVVTGTLDAEPVLMSAFTFRKQNCVTDIVLWQSAASLQVSDDLLSIFSRSTSQLTARLLDESLSLLNASNISSDGISDGAG